MTSRARSNQAKVRDDLARIKEVLVLLDSVAAPWIPTIIKLLELAILDLEEKISKYPKDGTR